MDHQRESVKQTGNSLVKTLFVYKKNVNDLLFQKMETNGDNLKLAFDTFVHNEKNGKINSMQTFRIQ